MHAHTRVERDLLGEKIVPAAPSYGVQTVRALENFHISGVELRLYPDLIRALAMVKRAAARANADCGVLERDILRAIEGAWRSRPTARSTSTTPSRWRRTRTRRTAACWSS